MSFFFYGEYSSLKKDLATSLAVVYLSLRENQNEFFNTMIEKVHWIFNLIISIPAKIGLSERLLLGKMW